MSDYPKLVIIRGPSSSGKSTVADQLFKQCSRPTVLISEDSIRKMFSDQRKKGHIASRQLAEKAVICGLDNGYDVIYHGILRINDEESRNRFDGLIKLHPRENYFFYLDVGLEETIKRHAERPKRHEFSAEAMKQWWEFSSPTQFDSETIIPEQSSVERTIQIIDQTASLKLNDTD